LELIKEVNVLSEFFGWRSGVLYRTVTHVENPLKLYVFYDVVVAITLLQYG